MCQKTKARFHLKHSRPAAVIGLSLISAAVASALAQAQAQEQAQTRTQDASRPLLNEVVVTANRRKQNVLDVPYNISVVSGSEIGKTGATSLDDLTRLVPGLIQSSQGPAVNGAGNNFIIRGLNADSPDGLVGIPVGRQQTVSPVSTYLGDIPVFVPLTMVDIERVEVLRGPQGTLYGSGSEGGTIRFIPNPPELNRTTAEVNMSAGMTDHAGNPNTDVSGVLNLPLGGSAALRLAVGYTRLAGFIDQVALVKTAGGGPLAAPVERVPGDVSSGFVLSPQSNTNNSDDFFVRSALRWQPTDRLRIDLFNHYQNTRVQDLQYANPYWPGGTIDYSAQQFPGSRGPDLAGTPGGGYWPNGSTYIPPGGDYADTKFDKQPNERKVDVLGAEIAYDLGFASLTSTTSYTDNKVAFWTDETLGYVNVTNPAGGVPLVAFYSFFPRLTVPTLDSTKEGVFTQELRLSSEGRKTIDYVAGLYFSDDKTHVTVDQYNPGITDFSSATTQFDANPRYGDLNWFVDRHMDFRDAALYGDLTWHVAARWQITGGARLFWQRFRNDYFQQLYICGAVCGDGISPDQSLGTGTTSSEQSFHNHVLKVNTSYDVTGSAKVYFTYSEGFRHGGANALPSAGYFASLPELETFKPDFVKNYELGVKGKLAGRATYSAALFEMNWTNFQFEGVSPSAFPATFNGGRATSRGAEFESTWMVTDRLRLSAGYAYTDAHLTSSFQIVDYPPYALASSLAPIVAISAPDGAPLPGASKSSATLSLDYHLPISADWSADLNANASYRSSASAAFPSAALFPAQIPSSTLVNLRGALNVGEHWTIDLAVRNLSNQLGLSTGIPFGHVGPFTDGAIARPRTFTLGVHFHT